MNKTEFTDLIINPDKLGNEHVDTLKKIVADYPFFSTAQILLAKTLLNTHHYEYEKQLKTTAISVANREVLHQFLNNNFLEIEAENSMMRVSNELKAEKVSRPDFEIGKEEQEALLNEAQNIISNQEISALKTENNFDNFDFSEPILENIVTEIPVIDNNTIEANIPEFTGENAGNVADNFNFSEPILENIITEIPVIDNNTIEANIPEFIKENVGNVADNFNFSEPILENIITEIPVIDKNTIEADIPEFTGENAGNVADNFDFSEPILENIITEIPVIDNNTIEADIPEFTGENVGNKTEIDFHLAETEGTLVRFVNAEVFLPNFDESSLFDDEQTIETITKSVLPNSINNIVVNTEIGEKTDELNDSEFTENTTKIEPIDELIISNEPIIESNILDTIEEETFTSNTIEEKEIITLENILESNIVTEISDNNTDNVIENVEENITESEIKTVETVDENIVEDVVALKTDLAESEAIIDANNLNFFEWLKANRKDSVEETTETPKSQQIKSYEDTAFVDKIKQIIKSKAELDLKNNIITGIDKAHDGIVPFERKNTLPESIEETVESIELDKNIIEEMNIEMIANANIDLYSGYDSENETSDDNIEQPEIYTSTEIYSSKVESILPDFEALKLLENKEEQSYIIFDKKEGLIPKYETPAFDPLFNSNYEVKVPKVLEPNNNTNKEPLVEINKEEVVNFDDFTIDNKLFEKSFTEIYIPLPKQEPKIDAEKLQNIQTIKVETDASKSEIENILDKFMRENPSISRPKTEFFNPATVAKSSAEEKDEIVSETLASIYLKQGLVKKSISTYEKLCLIYPLKNAYFAALIIKIKTEHNIN